MYAGTLVQASTIRVKVTVRRSAATDDAAGDTWENSNGEESEADAEEDTMDCEDQGKSVNEDVSDDEKGDEEVIEQEAEEDESDTDEHASEEGEGSDVGDDETTIYVNAQLASTLSKLRSAMKQFLDDEVVDTMAEAIKRVIRVCKLFC